MKSYYFISGLPRSGSTLLSSILKQNPEFYADIASPIEHITHSTIHLITGSENNLTVTEDQRKNLIHGIFEGYYKNIEKPIIFDSSRHWTRKTSFLKEIFPYTKILCPVRDIVSILNSFELITSKNPFYSRNLCAENDSVFTRCDMMMNKQSGIVSRPWIYLREGYALNPEMIMFIEYDDLCKNPEKTMKSIYKFLNKSYYQHDFNNINYSNELYDKNCNLKDLHTVRKKVEYNPPRVILPQEICDKYQEMNMEFWKPNVNVNKNIIENLNEKFINYQ